ncbi:methyltransferase family protein (plasmid) [Enterobacter asburiae]
MIPPRTQQGVTGSMLLPCLLFAVFLVSDVGSGGIMSPFDLPLPPSALTPAQLIAALCGILSLFLVLSGMLTLAFCADGDPRRPMRLVTYGCYSFSRNPVCLGMVGTHISTAIFCGSLAGLVFTPVLVMLLTTLHIRVRESEMACTFGDRWNAYCGTTPRWLPLPAFPAGVRRG